MLGHEEHESLENWAIIILVIIILLLSAIFEFWNHLLETWLEKQDLKGLKKMLNAVFKELTILGFITLLLFTAIRGGLAQKINDNYFGQSETEKAAIAEAEEKGETPAPPTTLQELFEEIHILIFIVMVMYICESAFLLTVGRYTIRRFEHFDRKSKAVLAQQLQDFNSKEAERVSKSELESSLAFYGLRERFLNPVISTFPKPHEKEFHFSKYLAAAYHDLLVELIEIPVMSLLFLLLLVFALRPFMSLEGIAYLIFMVACAFGLFLLTLGCTLLTHRVYRMLIPDLDFLKTHIQERLTNDMGRQESTATLLRSKTSSEKVFAANIDEYPVYAKTIWGARNRVERQFPGSSIYLFRSILQMILFLNAAFAAVVMRGIFTAAHHQSDLWWTHKFWSYPLTLGIIAVNLTLWVKLIREFNYVTVRRLDNFLRCLWEFFHYPTQLCQTVTFVFQSLDSQTNVEIIEEVEEHMEVEELQRYSHMSVTQCSKAASIVQCSKLFLQLDVYLHFLFHKAEHAHAKRSPEERAADMERVQLEFNRLPGGTKNLLATIFNAVSTRRPQLGEEGVVTQRDMREALELMGWAADETSAHIVETWFDERDQSQDGYLTFNGFVEVIMLSTNLAEFLRDPAETRTQRRQRLKALFEEMDTNKDHKVSPDELRRILTGLVPAATDREIKHLIKRIDSGSPEVEFEPLVEFVDFVEARTSAPTHTGGESHH